MQYNTIRKMDISNGPGCRVSVFTQGCDIHCPGCFNSSIWEYDTGNEWTNNVQKRVLSLCGKSYIKGLSILGGEPLSPQNYNKLQELFISFRNAYPDKDIWMWTGRIFENLNEEQLQVVKLVDVLVDGPWIASLGDFSLKFRGSSNQRIIDIKKTLEQKKVVTLDM